MKFSSRVTNYEWRNTSHNTCSRKTKENVQKVLWVTTSVWRTSTNNPYLKDWLQGQESTGWILCKSIKNLLYSVTTCFQFFQTFWWQRHPNNRRVCRRQWSLLCNTHWEELITKSLNQVISWKASSVKGFIQNIENMSWY